MELQPNKPLDGEVFVSICDLLEIKREHVKRLANTNGAAGEASVVTKHSLIVKRPKGILLKHLLAALAETGIFIKGSSFDVIALPEEQKVNFSDMDSIRAALPLMKFIEVKTANQKRVKPGFSSFFFALTESEIKAAEALGNRHGVLLLNSTTNDSLMTTVPAILARARSTTCRSLCSFRFTFGDLPRYLRRKRNAV